MRMLRALSTCGGALAALALAATTALAAESGPAERASPRGWLESKVKEAHALATRDVEPNTPGEEAWQAEAKVLIDDILDWPELTRRALGSNWRDLEEAERRRFSRLLRRLIEASYRSRLRYAVREDVDEPREVEIDWLEEDVDDDDADLVAKVSGGGESALLGFSLRWTDEGRWRVYDVAIDDLSTVRTYRSNFNKIIKRKGWDELIARLEQKTEDIEAGRADFARPGSLKKDEG
jgi:phospholipid transport system substrate-binding protein